MLIDILFLVFAGIGFYTGYNKGIVRTVVTAFSLIIAVLAAFRFAPFVADGLMAVFKSTSSSMFLIAFALTFIMVILLIRTVVKMIEKGFQAANINFVNKIAGGLVTGAIATLVLSLFLWFGDNAGLIKDKAKQESLTYESLEAFPGVVKNFAAKMKPKAKEFYEKSKESIEESRERAKERKEDRQNGQ